MLFSRGRYLSSEPSTKAGGSRVGGVVKDHDDDDGAFVSRRMLRLPMSILMLSVGYLAFSARQCIDCFTLVRAIASGDHRQDHSSFLFHREMNGTVMGAGSRQQLWRSELDAS